MKKGFPLFLISVSFLSLNAQKKEQIKDTLKTEVVNIVTKYNPKIADAKKIKKHPKIKLLKKNEKKKLEYTIFYVPVASTFIPKRGGVKKIDVSVKESIYKNYLATGFGSYTTPYFETFLYHSNPSKNEFGFNSKYIASQDNLRNSILNSNFSNFNTSAFYKKQNPYLDWKVCLNSERNLYNWYGLPNSTILKTTTINSINEEQIYNYFELIGSFNLKNAYEDFGKIKTSYFSDSYKSAEVLIKLDAKLEFPLKAIHRKVNNISLKTGIEFLKGAFKNSYKDFNPVKYTTTTIRLDPQYKFNNTNFIFKTGLKLITSLDAENNSNNVFIIPDLLVQQSILKNYLNIYGGFYGDLHTNTYKNFTEENPYVSPTLSMTQTLEKSNLFIGFNGKINKEIRFNIKTSAKKEENKPLFLRNASKYNETNNDINSTILKGYKYGNSFKVVYDDVNTTTLFTEVTYNYSKKIAFDFQGIYNIYTLKNELENWNLPTTEVSFSSKYKNNKWNAAINLFYISERKDALYNKPFPSNIDKVETINSFVDINLNSDYHFNNKFSAFLKLNNILNTEYQRFANFNTQGFQILGGITYKFNF